MHWKSTIENMNQEIMRSFSNFKNGTAILQVLHSYYMFEFSKFIFPHKNPWEICMIKILSSSNLISFVQMET